MRAFLFLSLSGCALVSGLSDVRVTDEDGAPIDSGVDAAEAASCATGCPVPPDGWQAVVRPDSNGSCGALAPTDWTTGIANDASVCPCNCTANPPSCVQGDVTIHFGDQCVTGGSVTAGKCNSLAQKPSYMSAVPLAPIGGGCGAPTTTPSNVMKVTSRTCALPAGCCAIAGQRACIVRTGMNACPADYPQQTIAGRDVNVTCQCAGACNFTGNCTNPQLHFYSDAMCAMASGQIVADGTCKSLGNLAAASIKYDATPDGTCSAKPGAPSTALVDTTTICCKN